MNISTLETQLAELSEALLLCKNTSDMENFLRDLCTLSEIQALSERLIIAKKLSEKKSYRSISEETGASTTTITRVNHWIHHGTGGYEHVLKQVHT